MLAIQKQSQIISKEIVLPNGVKAVALFLIHNDNGQLKARLISVRPLESQKAAALPVYFESQSVLPLKSICSEYCLKTFKDFAFLTSQLTRAPSRA
jgi:hypothetical protein